MSSPEPVAGKGDLEDECRADVVERELFLKMRDAGLYLVYMGLESGSEEGLKTLHKQITVEQKVARSKSAQEHRPDVGVRVHAARPVEHVRDRSVRIWASCGRLSATAACR